MTNIIQTIHATSVTDKEIILKNEDDLIRVYGFIKDNTNFVFKWKEKGIDISKLIIASNLNAKVENNEIVLLAKDTEVD